MTTTTAPISSTYDLRVSLPALPTDLVPAVVAERIANLSRLIQATQEAVRAVDAAERDVRAAEVGDEAALAAALLRGTDEPAPALPAARDALAAAETRREALRAASTLARNELAEAATDHADEWAARTGKAYAAAVGRFEDAAAAMQTAAADLTATGEVLTLLRSNPAALIVGLYLPGAQVSVAVQETRHAAVAARQVAKG